MSQASRTRQEGFTLMEVLVVLTITGLVTAILFQALTQVYRMQERLGAQLQRSQGGAMQLDWFRQVVQQLQPDEGARMQGGRSEIRSLGLDPLGPEAGRPLPMRLTLEVRPQRTRLLWLAGDREVSLAEWSDLRDAEFVFVDDKGERHARWPAEEVSSIGGSGAPAARELAPALPAAVLLHLRDAEGGDEWISAVPRCQYRQGSRPGQLWSLER